MRSVVIRTVEAIARENLQNSMKRREVAIDPVTAAQWRGQPLRQQLRKSNK